MDTTVMLINLDTKLAMLCVLKRLLRFVTRSSINTNITFTVISITVLTRGALPPLCLNGVNVGNTKIP